MNEYISMWQNFANFNDKTNVRGYWMAVVFNVLATVIISVIAGITGLTILSSLYALAILVPSLAMTVRRLRDAGKKWFMIFVSFIPLVGGIWLIILLASASDASAEGATV